VRQEIERASTGAEARRVLSVRLGSFGWRAVEKAAGACGSSTEELVADACIHLLAEADKGRPAASVPSLPAPMGEQRELEVSLPTASWESLEAEAEHQAVELERLIVHAVLLHISDMDTGRATGAILDDLTED
jgi:hypothetical protein